MRRYRHVRLVTFVYDLPVPFIKIYNFSHHVPRRVCWDCRRLCSVPMPCTSKAQQGLLIAQTRSTLRFLLQRTWHNPHLSVHPEPTHDDSSVLYLRQQQQKLRRSLRRRMNRLFHTVWVPISGIAPASRYNARSMTHAPANQYGIYVAFDGRGNQRSRFKQPVPVTARIPQRRKTPRSLLFSMVPNALCRSFTSIVRHIVTLL